MGLVVVVVGIVRVLRMVVVGYVCLMGFMVVFLKEGVIGGVGWLVGLVIFVGYWCGVM